MSTSYREFSHRQFIERVRVAWRELKDCRLCARECGVDRTAGERGFCRTKCLPAVASFGPHPGEEAPLRGTRGSGTIFFCGCNLRCVYCQNYDISRADSGWEISLSRLGRIMLSLEHRGCHNVNLVSPSHVIPQVIAGLFWAAERGLSIPIVFNTAGYDALRGLKLLDGLVDIYMPDMKYADSETAERLSAAPDYPEVNRESVKEMHRQVGNLKLDERGLACRGLLVRHLVLPGGLAGTGKIVQFIADEISPETYTNVMGQYYPAYRAHEFEDLDKPTTRSDLRSALKMARGVGLRRVHF